jgi:hypothetical protein
VANSVRFRVLPAPPSDLSGFDPGTYVSELDVVETENALTEADRDGLAQFLHYVAYLALSAGSSAWPGATIPVDSSIYRALATHFGHLRAWEGIPIIEGRISYRALVSFLMPEYPPRKTEA